MLNYTGDLQSLWSRSEGTVLAGINDQPLPSQKGNVPVSVFSIFKLEIVMLPK